MKRQAAAALHLDLDARARFGSGEQFVGPLWGLGSMSIESDRRPSTFTGRTAKPDPDHCAAIQWTACSQSGSMVMKLRFTPA